MRKAPPALAGLSISLLLPLIYCLLVLAFDMKAPFRSVSPPLLTMGLLGLSFVLRPGWMILWAILYSSIAGTILLNRHLWLMFSNGYLPPETTSHWYRIAGFLATASFAVGFSIVLDHLRKKRESLDHLIRRLPMPVLLSNAAGDVLLINDQARQLLNLPSDPDSASLGPNYFDLLAPTGKHGKCVSEYLACFESGRDHVPAIPLEIKGRTVTGHFEVIRAASPSLLTMITLEPISENIGGMTQGR